MDNSLDLAISNRANLLEAMIDDTVMKQLGDGFHHAIIFRICVTSIPSRGLIVSTDSDLIEYMARTKHKIDPKKLESMGFLSFFVPVHDEKTRITFVNLETMKSVSV